MALDSRQIIWVQRCHERPDGCLALRRRQELFECGGLDDKPGRHGDAGAHEFAQTAAFAADLRPVGKTDVGKPAENCESLSVIARR